MTALDVINTVWLSSIINEDPDWALRFPSRTLVICWARSMERRQRKGWKRRRIEEQRKRRKSERARWGMTRKDGHTEWVHKRERREMMQRWKVWEVEGMEDRHGTYTWGKLPSSSDQPAAETKRTEGTTPALLITDTWEKDTDKLVFNTFVHVMEINRMEHMNWIEVRVWQRGRGRNKRQVK